MNQKELLIISLTVFLTVVVWVIADLHHTSITKKVEVNNQAFLKPIQTDINIEIISALEQKK